ncbi:MAG: RNA methyltransferase [Polyangiaceae bacterium]|nr:RNA methyltransferase [Polyangiaceae bacterium]MCL4755387.1 RNA methyltransferase [Myxococcales bacterium]
MKPEGFAEDTPTPDLRLPIHALTTFVLVRPHYPENVGAAARAIKTMGFLRLALVRPGRLAAPNHEMALKMAVKSKDVLLGAPVYQSLDEALGPAGWVVGTTSRRGVSGVLTARDLGRRAVERGAAGQSLVLVFGNEKTGLGEAERALCQDFVRIPMAADQPSINLAQATQVIAYELLLAALDARADNG